MNKKRKAKLKKQKEARRQFYTIVRRSARLEYLQQKMMKRNPGSFAATFCFSPDEVGITPAPPQEVIDKVGLERALQRLDREDFHTFVSVRVRGEPTKLHLAKIREEVRTQTAEKIRTGTTGIDLSKFASTAGAEDEVNR